MKKMIFALMMMLTATVSASAMSYEQARNEALFLTDKMAYELNLTDAQYEAAYEINLDYLMSVTSYNDVFGTYWERRNLDLSYILYSWQWEAFRAATYFYRPLYWDAGYWHFAIYARYPHRDYFYFGRPHFYATYRGGHAWHMNGGRSYYHGRDNHFRPAVPQGRQHFGMRNSFDRGDYRGVRGSGSSTRITGRDRNDNRGFGRGNDRPNRSTMESGRFGNGNDRPNRGTMERGNTERPSRSTIGSGTSTERPNRSTVGSGTSTERPNRSTVGSGSERPSRSFGSGSSSTPSRSSMGSSSSAPSRSIGHSSGSMSSRPSGGSSRSVGSGSRPSGGSSNSHGHFGGSRGR
jgi:hypothetical protein